MTISCRRLPLEGQQASVETPFRNTRIFDVSPDRTEFLIGDFVARKPGLPLWIWPVQGGSPVRVGDLVVDDASWAPDGQHIFYVRDRDIRHSSARRHRRSHLDSLARVSALDSILPDGRVFSFTVTTPQSDSETLWEASADGSNPLHPIPWLEQSAVGSWCRVDAGRKIHGVLLPAQRFFQSLGCAREARCCCIGELRFLCNLPPQPGRFRGPF